jgi:hypothetical protein
MQDCQENRLTALQYVSLLNNEDFQCFIDEARELREEADHYRVTRLKHYPKSFKIVYNGHEFDGFNLESVNDKVGGPNRIEIIIDDVKFTANLRKCKWTKISLKTMKTD